MSERTRPSSIMFHYIKSNFFRVIHLDGAIGGVTPSRDIFVSLFSQRGALPKVIEQVVLPDGKLGEETKREGKNGIVREMEVGVTMNANAAKDLADFLYAQIKLLEQSKLETPSSPEDAKPRANIQ